MNFFLGKGEYISTISEALPVFLTSDGNLTFTPILGSLGLCFLTALGGFFLLGLEWRGEKSKPEGVFFPFMVGLFRIFNALSKAFFVSVRSKRSNAYLILTLGFTGFL